MNHILVFLTPSCHSAFSILHLPVSSQLYSYCFHPTRSPYYSQNNNATWQDTEPLCYNPSANPSANDHGDQIATINCIRCVSWFGCRGVCPHLQLVNLTWCAKERMLSIYLYTEYIPWNWRWSSNHMYCDYTAVEWLPHRRRPSNDRANDRGGLAMYLTIWTWSR